MASLDAKKTYKNLLKKGFRDFDHKSKEHIRIDYWVNDQLSICKTKLSHNNQEINDSLISLMAKQVSLSNKEFIKLADCTMNGEQYREILKQKEII